MNARLTITLKSRFETSMISYQIYNSNIIQQMVYDDIRPSGSQRPRLHALPNTHKTDIPRRRILSMVGSSQHELAIFLAVTLQPVLELY